jgi:hypothetical protein
MIVNARVRRENISVLLVHETSGHDDGHGIRET